MSVFRADADRASWRSRRKKLAWDSLARMGMLTLPSAFGSFPRSVLEIWAATRAARVAGLFNRLLGTLLLVRGVLCVVCPMPWRRHRPFRKPLVTALYADDAWLALAPLLSGLALVGIGLDPPTALKAFTTAATDAVTLTVMTRASLRHSGRTLAFARPFVASKTLVVTGAVLRLPVAVMVLKLNAPYPLPPSAAAAPKRCLAWARR